jgi:hypothetical protein
VKVRGKIGIASRGMTMIKILKRILNLIYKKISSKDKIQILGSIADETLNLEVSDIGIEGRIAVSEIHPESIRFYKHINDNNKIISICEYKNKKE